jgi:D-sedoheptulose 7-phosphate isomerase
VKAIQPAIYELQQVLSDMGSLSDFIDAAGQVIVSALTTGHKVLTCGNGGSAADALHFAEELVGRYSRNRRALPAVCLNADATALTCIANDFGFENIFSRAVEALGAPGDVIVGFSTSGNSVNVRQAIQASKEKGLVTIMLLGKGGGQSKGLADFEIIVPSQNTARIQEVHTLVLHSWLDVIDAHDWNN